MKSNDSKKATIKTKANPGYLATRALEAEKQAEVARKLARLAKAKFKDARKAFKQAKKFAKLARREAKAAAKALKTRLNQPRKPARKKPATPPKPAKAAAQRIAAPAPVVRPRRKPMGPLVPVPSIGGGKEPASGTGPTIAQA